jgi:hypothetical protein
MSLMHLAFILIAAAGACYFLLSLRRFDFFAVAFFSGCVYFLPGFFGYTAMPVGIAAFASVELEDQTYLVMLSVLLAIWAGAFVFDHVAHGDGPSWDLGGADVAALCAVMLAILGYGLTIVTSGEALLDDDKIAMMESLNRWYVLGATAAPLGAVLAYASKRWVLFLLALGLLLFDMYIGFRIAFAIALIAIFTVHLSRSGPQRMALQNWRLGCIGLACVAFFFVYKQLYIAVKLGLWDVVLDRLQDSELYASALMMSEPFNTQAILNEVVAQDFRVGMGHLKDVALQFVLFSAELGSAPVSFNDLFQATLFPADLDYGMANNMWAEMLSSGGWPLLGAFLLCFIALLTVGSSLIRSRDLSLVAGTAVAFSYWAFYIHRNDLLNQINLEKRVVLIWFLCALLSLSLRSVHVRWRGDQPSPSLLSR